jgi:hypothetical protein
VTFELKANQIFQFQFNIPNLVVIEQFRTAGSEGQTVGWLAVQRSSGPMGLLVAGRCSQNAPIVSKKSENCNN